MINHLSHPLTDTALTDGKRAQPTPTQRRWLRLLVLSALALVVAALVTLLLTNLVFTGLPLNTNAPYFVGTTLNDEQLDLAALRGQPVMLTFWSPDCFACREELPALQALAADPNTDMQLVTIVSHLEPTAVEEFATEQGLTFPILVDPAGTIAEEYEVSGIPFTYLIDQNGVIDEKVMGAGQEGELQNQLGLWLNSCQVDAACTVE